MIDEALLDRFRDELLSRTGRRCTRGCVRVKDCVEALEGALLPRAPTDTEVVAFKLHEALEFMRDTEASGSGNPVADHPTVIGALEAARRAGIRGRAA